MPCSVCGSPRDPEGVCVNLECADRVRDLKREQVAKGETANTMLSLLTVKVRRERDAQPWWKKVWRVLFGPDSRVWREKYDEAAKKTAEVRRTRTNLPKQK